MVSIQHLSLSVCDPERAATITAALTGGAARPFRARGLTGAWICLWDASSNHLIEFLPLGAVLWPAEGGAAFRQHPTPNTGGTHIQLCVDTPLEALRAVAARHGCLHRLRPRRGGPLMEIWVEDTFLVELVSDEITAACEVLSCPSMR